MGIFHFDEEVKKQEEEPILKMIGVKMMNNKKVFSGTFDYVTPLLLSYKHKINTLDDHVRNIFLTLIYS